MSRRAKGLWLCVVAAVSAACGDAALPEGDVPDITPSMLSPLGISSACQTQTAGETFVVNTSFNTLRTGTSSERLACDYFIVELTNATGADIDDMHASATIPQGAVVLESHCNQSALTQKYYGYIPGHYVGGWWFPAAWYPLNETTTYGTWSNSHCLILPPASAAIEIQASVYTKIRAFTKLTYVDPQYVTRRGPAQTWFKGHAFGY